MKGYNIALPLHGLGRQKWVRSCGRYGTRRRENSSEVIDKHRSVFVYLILLTTGTFISWAEVALGVILRQYSQLGRLDLALPRPLASLRRYQYMISRQGVN